MLGNIAVGCVFSVARLGAKWGDRAVFVPLAAPWLKPNLAFLYITPEQTCRGLGGQFPIALWRSPAVTLGARERTFLLSSGIATEYEPVHTNDYLFAFYL